MVTLVFFLFSCYIMGSAGIAQILVGFMIDMICKHPHGKLD